MKLTREGSVVSYTFSNRNIFGTPSLEGAIHELARADFNGDGIDDIMAARFLFPLENRGLAVQVLVGDGAGGFTDQTSTVFAGAIPTTVHPREFVLGDFNGDGRPDVFIADHGYDATPFPGAQNRLILSTGPNHLRDATANIPQRLDFTHSAAAGDIDGDGDLDIYVGNVSGQQQVTPRFLVNDGTGVFTADTARLPAFTQNVAIGPAFNSVALVDLNRDNLPELVLGTAREPLGKTQVLINPGNGNFASATSIAIPTPVIPNQGPPVNQQFQAPETYDIQTINLNGDAFPDLAVTWLNASWTAGYVQLLVNEGGTGFRDETAARLPQQASDGSAGWIKYIHLHDFDRDGDTDILTDSGAGMAGRAILYANNGSGSFAQAGSISMTGPVIEPVDANRDGRWDIVAATGGNGATFGLLTNTGTGNGAAVTAALAVPLAGAADEGTFGAGATTFLILRSGQVTAGQTVTWSVAGSGVNPASASDFAGGVLPGGQVYFAPEETRKVVTVFSAADSTFEGAEGFTLTIASTTQELSVSVATAAGLILDDDGGISVSRNGVPTVEVATPYSGPVTYLQYQFLGGPAGEIVGGSGANEFMNLLGGDDAANGGGGSDVLDGGTGSNFLSGGAARDVFFLDGRGGSVTWSTIVDWEAGEQLSLWGWRPGTSRVTWVDSDGVGNFKGVTMHGDLNGDGVFDTSVTWSRMTMAGLPTPVEFEGLLWFIG